ncbi:hypothetical protein C9374_011883 [Naegleria lovaniensis]|uniref:Uncharacterized protein n=1 Tax=Naegleria lovaniensis TaxID=51637 RepID=A0AA88KEC1_NAELO|nr:uncharacterized protein C9374_011883 [Naegleria lovaniensis]KAG2373594.1 hypothetical protein C9374_011883 [Naegleria lovaniensis]
MTAMESYPALSTSNIGMMMVDTSSRRSSTSSSSPTSSHSTSSSHKKHSPLFERRHLTQPLSVSLKPTPSTSTSSKSTMNTQQVKPTFHLSQYYTRDEIEEIYFHWIENTHYIKLYE